MIVREARWITRTSLLAVICLSAGLSVTCAEYLLPPVKPDPEFLGCWSLDTNPPESYADSLGYRLPELIHLGYSQHGQWTGLPTDEDWPPSWTVHDQLPRGLERRRLGM